MKRARIDKIDEKTHRVMLEVLADIIEKETKPTIVTSNGGRCKKCGGTTTYTRQNSASGECFACEHNLKENS